MENLTPFALPSEEIDDRTPRSSLPRSTRSRFPLKIIAGAVLFLLAVAGVVAWSVFGNHTASGSSNIRVWFDVPAQVTSGSGSDISIVYENHENQGLKNASLDVVYPNSYKFITSSLPSRDGTGHHFDLPDLPAGGTGKVLVTGIFSGSPDETQQLQASLYYSLSNTNATYSVRGQATLTLQAPDFNLRINAPAQVISSQRIEYLLSFQNISSQDINRMQMRVALPDGFTYATSSLPTLDHQTWNLGTIAAGQAGQLTIAGSLTGSVGDQKTVKAELGYIDASGGFVLQNRSYFTNAIVPPPLALTLTVNAPGATLGQDDRVAFDLGYQNNGTSGLTNVRLGVILDGDAIDFASLSANSGALVGRQLLWNPASQPNLALLQPGQNGTVHFSFGLKRNLPALHLQNPQLVITPFFSSDELPDPLLAGAKTLKIHSMLNGSTLVQYASGQQPPQAGSDTIYKITLHIETGVNGVNSIEWDGLLNLPSVAFVDNSASLPPDEKLSFNPSSGRILWTIPQLGSGKIHEMTFSVRFNPTQDQNGAIPLLKSSTLSGTDAFTGDQLTSPLIPDVTEQVSPH